ncbi:hypothetical protein F3K39_19040 [Streptomyces sp. LBUM 1479]|uniref:hypothetical protein n=1 Tax=Streptomyces scabiei TaxID=1930 RepID=UPI001B30A409|nr:hypothetical protein [Streptomyces sp. LBUM 1475]MBP5930165.1 hypothetical protein [Streptomyces sp. LBUM 1479]QTU63150.1 hypothetical protein F3K22_20910 [Streptomyces sp. LBUM 1475]
MPEPRTLPHDPYITAVVDALTAAGLEPTTAETRFDPDSGNELDALLVWDGDAAGLNTDECEDGFVLLWEHPAEQWQWAPRLHHGALEWEPEFLASLPRWVDPAVVVIVVRELLAGRPAPTSVGPLWTGHAQTQAAVDAWAESES